jgi:CHAD domain-containing protein
MQEKNTSRWLLPETISPDQLIKKISDKFYVQVGPPQKWTVTYFDSFDWRLYRKNYLLNQSDRTWRLCQRDSGQTVATFLEMDGARRKFAWEFPEDPLKSILKSMLEVRGLLALVTFEIRSRRLRVFNSDKKTVTHIDIETRKVKANPHTFHTVSLESVRGYENITRKLGRYLGRCGISDPVSIEYLFKEGIAAMGRSPRDYSSKFSITLAPTLSIHQAAKAIFRQLLETMRCNEAGIMEDIDSEFLHDFRVAIRRTRSGLSQLKGILPPDITQTFKREFAYLGQVTGPTRDLDVYLLYEKDYLSRLPEALREGMAGFFAEMAERRQREWEKMVMALRSTRYLKIIGDWQAYLDRGDEDKMSGHSGQPVDQYARKIIFRRYGRIIKKGRAIGSSSPDEALHRLRIQCKKLRYSLEFFASLFPPKAVKRAIKQLKGLQNNLGGFNDLSVQQDMLQNYLTTIRPGSKKNQNLAVAIGGLLTALHHEQKEVRGQFVTTFEQFSGSKNSRLFLELFG